jgi:alanine racemase
MVYYRQKGDSKWNYESDSAVDSPFHSVSLQNLKPGTEYQYYVRSTPELVYSIGNRYLASRKKTPKGVNSPVLTLKTRVAQVRELPAGATIGYGRTWRLKKKATIATISAGYADGLPLALTNRGSVFIGGKRCRIVGRISIDYTTVDVTGVEGVKRGDEVICFGRCGEDAITPDDWARLKGTHAYDIICSLGNRVKRVIS